VSPAAWRVACHDLTMASEEPGSWSPDGGVEDPVMISRRNKTRPGTSVVRLSNTTNRFCGLALSWGALALAWVLLGRDSLAWDDAFSPGALALAGAIALVFSLTIYVWLARPYVDLDVGLAWVRNPLRVVELPLAIVDRVDRTWGSHLRVHAGSRRLVLWGLEQPLQQALVGYSENASVLLAETAACGGVGDLSDARSRSSRATSAARRSAALVAEDRARTGLAQSGLAVVTRWKVLDLWLGVLLVGWAAYVAWIVPAIFPIQ
jgi:hypothetical protein